MSTLSVDVSNDRGRPAAVLWVAGVGAALLVVAAGLFVAVRWNDLPPEGKLAVILGLTGAFLLAGSALRRTLPATGSVLFHLGAFLLPVDLGAMNLRIGWSWEELLLAEGLLGVVAFGGLGRLSGSVVLERAAAVSVVATALGIGATTPVAAPVALAVVAALYSIRSPRSPVAVAWAAVAGFMPALALALDGAGAVTGPLRTLGLEGAHEPVVAVAAGVLSAVVLGRAAHLGRDLSLALVSLGSLLASAGTAWLGADMPRAADVVALPAAFVVVELASFAAGRDELWSRIARPLAGASEIAVLFVAVSALGFVGLAPAVEEGSLLGTLDPNAANAAAFVLLAAGSLLAAARLERVTGDAVLRSLASVGAAIFAVAAVQWGTASAGAVASALAAAAVALVLLRHPLTDAFAAAAAIYAPITAQAHPEVAFAAAVAGSAALVWSAYAASRDGHRLRAAALTGAALVALGTGALLGAGAIGDLGAALAFVAGAFGAAAFVGRADRDVALGSRFAALAAVLPSSFFARADRLSIMLALVALVVVETVRTGDRRVAYGVVVPLPIVAWDVARAASLDVPRAGIALCVAAFVWAGLSEAYGRAFRIPLAVTAATCVALGLSASSTEPAALGLVLVVSGALGLAAGLGRSAALSHAGAGAITLGAWIQLAVRDVGVAEAYVALPALHLLVAGALARREGRVSSWAAYVPSLAIFGVTATVERVGGGPGWHAVLAGATGVVAVAAGGWRRLAGPLVVGTGLLGIVVGYESLAVAASVPTWAWLALGGSALLATGIALERADTSPAEAGRRIVDAVQANFE